MKDEELLRAYSERGLQEPFAELVHRHMSLVYGTARRQIGDPHVAEDICQKVFCTLAQNAKSIRKPEQLPGWLYRTTRQLAAMHFRSEGRRLRRERLAAVNIDTMDQSESWNEIEPLLDQAIDSLAEADRLAILLRFFRGNSMAEVGASLGVSEAAAKMRLGRALEKLRVFFASNGINCSVAGLLTLLHHNAAASVPPAVTASVLKSLDTWNIIAKAPATAQHISSAGFKMAAALVAVCVTVSLFGLKVIRSNQAPDPPSNPTLAAAAVAVNGANGSSVALADPAAKAAVSSAAIRLRVLDRDTLRPLAGVRATASYVGKKLGDAVTDENGGCELPRPAPTAGDFYFRIRAHTDGFAASQVSWSMFQHDEPSDIPSEYVLKMSRGVRVGGTVLDDEGHPLAGIQVKVFGRSIHSGPPPRERALLNDGGSEFVTTDAGGRWTFDRLPTEWDKVHFIVSTSTFLPSDFVSDANGEGRIGQVKIPKEEFLELRAALRLQRGNYLSGLILNENRQPIMGARVVQNYQWHEPHAKVTNRNDGAFEILNAQTGSLTLSIQAAHYSPQTLSLTVEGPMTNAPIILKPGHVLRGRVTGADGSGVADAGIEVESLNRPKEFEWSTRTDTDGRFAWDGAPEQPASYGVYKSGFRRKQVTLTADGSEQTIALERLEELTGIRVQGRVVNDETSQFIEKYQILVAERGQNLGAAKEGTEGVFSLRLGSDSKSCAIEVRADGFAPARIDNVSTTEGDKTLEFRLRPSSGWNGQVLLPNGEPAVGAEVALSRHAGGPILGNRRLLFKEESINRVVDANGRFHFDPVGETKNGPMFEGRNIVVVHQQGYAERDVEQLARSPIIKLQPWGRIEGVLRSAGQALANEKVCVQMRMWNPWISSIHLHVEQFTTTTDANGSFFFDSIPPGEHKLGHLFRGGLMESRATIQVKPGETAKVDLGGNGRAVLGHIVVPGRESNFDFSYSRGHLTRRQAQPIDLPRTVRQRDFPNDEAYLQAAKEEAAKLTAYWQSAVGLAAWREHRIYAVWFDADGTFHADDIPAGDYELNVILQGPNPQGSIRFESPMLGIYLAPVTVPQKNASDENKAANLGDVTLESEFK